MTDQPEMPPWSNESHDYPAPRGRSGGDSTLMSLEVLVNVTKGSIGVLLVIPGGLLRGLLVSSTQWHSEWFASIAEAGEAGASAHAILKGMFGATGQLTSEGEMIDHLEHYLYIKDGYFATGAGEQGPMPWKVKLSSIVAWSIGNRPPA
ncbi:hypothetical protein [Nonomuraea rubra]|uniref:Uncharacterized protein n=1 Tax=Nonomuraea rubra TaxID=46180 RepID=A0A7X0P891_9ACTN|nr:hypothetical protein [Nonomuraea rubra]MBB6557094.1 hypothetical protein [Nonomuraea rubra]